MHSIGGQTSPAPTPPTSLPLIKKQMKRIEQQKQQISFEAEDLSVQNDVSNTNLVYLWKNSI